MDVRLVVRCLVVATVCWASSMRAQTPAKIDTASPDAPRLNEIVVKERGRDPMLAERGFYHRQKVASGMFFDTDAIDHFGGDGLPSLVRQVPRVDVRHLGDSDYAFGTIAGRTCRMNIYIDGMFQRLAMPAPGGADGRAPEGVGLKDLVGFRDIAAVEVYPRATSVPTQFMRMGPPAGPQGVMSSAIGSPRVGYFRTPPSQGENADAACGAIVIWTRSPAAVDANPSNP